MTSTQYITKSRNVCKNCLTRGLPGQSESSDSVAIIHCVLLTIGC